MKKYNFQSVSWSILSVTLVSVFVLAPLGVFAASTIGTNMSTTGTFLVNPAANSTTSVRFQNAAGTNYLIGDSTNARIGVGAAPSTTFEVQGTASASYLMTANTLQVGGVASVAYNRFGTSATNHANYITTTNDLLIVGDLEVRATASFGSVASVSGILFLANGQVRPGMNNDSTTAFRFQNAAGTTTVLTIDTTNRRVGVGDTPSTKFEVQGTASASYFFTPNAIQVAGLSGATASVAYSRFGTATTGHATDIDASNDLLLTGALEVNGKTFLDGTASVAVDFEVVGYASAGNAFITRNLVVGSNVASSSTAYVAEFVKAGTASMYFGSSDGTKGSCLQLTDTAGKPVYARVYVGGTALTVSTVSCR
ncbi:MAG: hypothetical protein A2915_03395 [Candidatus Yanofskybacteria bacterium RIFCSPLOWO2_01_FULL_41_34]|uniref:Uncharacterized protein n=1 Tax=Candidatus Yanofskybacteria bacterium RIFCSPHIGHO2_01_FULL_41_26 TaxID=1802661 RepID=A0A1F8EDT1_9BACT|nr:MAG: hypothetical protein A2649_01290 [Candidatus Yanofskybacteria bacterium RIFCSPHIGHO2_01_FULL_41_26]OGN21075.1 MAG: hypothetical protein A2915_03395 [Candidatus Yanofskybacteria bacterium RIFCSPLOWO2_01_FULL_41_34]